MGIILDEYYGYREKYKKYMPKEVYNMLKEAKNKRADMLKPTQEDKNKYFVEGLEDLSLAIFNLMYSGKGYYIINYSREFNGINRKAAGFETKEDIVHYAIWVIEDFFKTKSSKIEYLEELKNNSIGKSDNEMLRDVLLEEELSKQLKEVTLNMKEPKDMERRLALIEILKQNKTLSHHLLSNFAFYQILDDIYTALEKIPNVHIYNTPPKPIKQNFWESRMV